jgi:hypothetical protein
LEQEEDKKVQQDAHCVQHAHMIVESHDDSGVVVTDFRSTEQHPPCNTRSHHAFICKIGMRRKAAIEERFL